MPYYAVFGTILQEQARRMRRVVSEIIFRPFILKFISLPPSQAIKGLAAKISNYAVFEKNQLFTVFIRFSEVCHWFPNYWMLFTFLKKKNCHHYTEVWTLDRSILERKQGRGSGGVTDQSVILKQLMGPVFYIHMFKMARSWGVQTNN